MSDNIAIRVENLGKLYKIGERERYYSFRDRLTTLFTAPFRYARSVMSRNGSYPSRRRPSLVLDKSKTSRGGRGSPGAAPLTHNESHIWALKDVSFEIKRGEVVGVIGRNGAGKSTLLKILSRITEPTEGGAEIHGRVRSLLEVGTGFHPELTGRENILLNGAIMGMKRVEIRRKFDEIVAFAEVGKFIDTPVKRYSSGMYVRLAFAVAAHLEPEVLLVDEVLAVGDAEFQKKCLGKMGDVAKEGRTVVIVSHNMPSIMNLCERAILLREGEVIKDGRAAEVVQAYLAVARSAGGEVTWSDVENAPGNDLVRLQAVRIFQEGIDASTADVDISKEVRIEISYWNLQENAKLYTSIWLRDQVGTVVLASGSHKSISLTEDLWYGKPRPVGSFRALCKIPANFLNEGLYSVTAIVGTGSSETQILQDYVLSFHVHDTGEMRKEFYGTWIGTVRPKLAWSTEYLPSMDPVTSHAK
ncbi:MAG: ABC transporter ATP-binding protein [Chlamydiae bacterium]|nr:ABC transporter ATP-binding protein [Chlamydiota bacterium]MBI3267046.1 ABC transporter ATP-binding protein [Chlamydiota bacterium]